MEQAWFRRGVDGLRLAVTLLTAIPLPGPRPKDSNGRPPAAPPATSWFSKGYGSGGAGQGPPPGHPEAAGPRPPVTTTAPPPPTRQSAGDAMALAPAVGLALGAAAAVVLYVFQRYWHAGPLLGSALAIITLAVLTRGLHLDGLADTADGLGSRRPVAGALEIMRRSDIGPFGVAVLVLTLLLQVTALTQADALGRGVTSVAAAALCGRLAMAWGCGRGIPAARPDGLGALVAGSLHPAVPAALSALAVAGSSAYGLIFPVAMAAGLAAGLLLCWLAVRRLGGITGDVLGAICEVSTAACLLVLALS